MRFDVAPLALPGLLDVLGRQPADGGLVLMVRPQLAGVTLTVQPHPQMPVGVVVVDVPVSDEMPGEAKTRQRYLQANGDEDGAE